MKRIIFLGILVLATMFLNLSIVFDKEKAASTTLSIIKTALAQCEGSNGSYTMAQSVMTQGLYFRQDASCENGLRIMWCDTWDCIECWPGTYSCTYTWCATDYGCI